MVSAARKGKGKAPEPKVIPQLPLGKQLAHTDKAVRDGAVRNLRAFLSRGETDGGESSTFTRINDAEMAKLWKGLFYCFWMSDKPLIQQSLARELADLILSINPRKSKQKQKSQEAGEEEEEATEERERKRDEAALGYLKGFWECIIREWEGIDRLRMDKFYLLIRRFVNATFRLLARSGWNEDRVKSVNAILSGSGGQSGPLDYSNPRIPISLSTHLSDIYLTELNAVLVDSTSTSTAPAPAPLALILDPFSLLLARSVSPVVFTRLMDTLYRPFFRAMDARSARAAAAAGAGAPVSVKIKKRKNVQFGEGEGESDGFEGIVSGTASTPGQVKHAVLKAMFDHAARADARDANRRKVYLVWNEFGGGGDDDGGDDEDW